jgi:hypothetical protein
MSVGEVPKDCLEEESKEDIFLAGGAGTIDDDEYGLNDYDDGYSNEDLDGLSEAEY